MLAASISQHLEETTEEQSIQRRQEFPVSVGLTLSHRSTMSVITTSAEILLVQTRNVSGALPMTQLVFLGTSVQFLFAPQ